MKHKIEALQKLATEMVGDGGSPNLFFVTDEGVVVTVTRDLTTAYSEWRKLSTAHSPRKECGLEDRKWGTICSVEPKAENAQEMVTMDDVIEFRRRHG